MNTHFCDLLVVGAGPAGCACAIEGARRGCSVLVLEREAQTRRHPLVVSEAAITLAERLGVRTSRPPTPIDDVRLRLGLERTFDLTGAGSATSIVTYSEFVGGLRLAVTEAGAALTTGSSVWHIESGRVAAVDSSGCASSVAAPVIVLAVGAGSPLAAGPRIPGRAIVAVGAGDGRDWMERLWPLVGPDQREIVSAYGWVAPAGDSLVLGAGATGRSIGAERLESLLASVAEMTGAGRSRSVLQEGAIEHGFSPTASSVRGAITVGDACGLANPFTGEGITAALRSGALVGRAIGEAREAGRMDLISTTELVAPLARSFAGFGDAFRHSALRQQMVWRFLRDGARNRAPFMDLVRRSLFLPEAAERQLATTRGGDVGTVLTVPRLRLRRDLAAATEHCLAAVRRDWPMAGDMLAATEDTAVPMRLSLVATLTSYMGARRPAVLTRVCAALELLQLAAFAQATLGPERDAAAGKRKDVAVAGSLLVGDLLLSSALEAASLAGRRAARAFLAATRELSKRRLRDLQERPDWRRDPRRDFEGVPRPLPRMLALAGEMGAAAGKLDATSTAAVVAYGGALGWALELEHEVRVWSAPDGNSAELAAQRMVAGDFGMPAVIAAGDSRLAEIFEGVEGGDGGREEAIRLVRASSAAEICLAHAREFRLEAYHALRPLPNGAACDSLEALARCGAIRITGYD